MINVRYQLDWVKGFPDRWQNISGSVCKIISERDVRIPFLLRRRASPNPFRVQIGQKDTKKAIYPQFSYNSLPSNRDVLVVGLLDSVNQTTDCPDSSFGKQSIVEVLNIHNCLSQS